MRQSRRRRSSRKEPAQTSGSQSFVVFHQGRTATAGELRAYLGKSLPDYMIPASFTALDALPLTANGKVDRSRLSRSEGVALDPNDGRQSRIVPPTTPTEQLLAGIWADLLKLEDDRSEQRLSVHDSFFDLGGHSLLATQLLSRVRDAFDVELPLRSLFEAPTLAGSAATVDAALASKRHPGVPRPAPIPRDGRPLPLSFGQQRFWFLDQLERAEDGGSNPFYNVPSAVRLRGELNVDALHHAFNEIVRRHEVLRTTFGEEGGKPVERVAGEIKSGAPSTRLANQSAQLHCPTHYTGCDGPGCAEAKICPLPLTSRGKWKTST